MAIYSLSLYRICISKANHPNEFEILDCFDGGKNLIEIIDTMLTKWHSILNYYDPYSLGQQKSLPRVNRIKCDSAAHFIHYRTGRYLSGIIESGAYGTEQSIIDYKSGRERYRKGKDEAPMVPFYFCFFFPRGSKFGYLVLERIGNDGIFTMLSNAIKDELLLYVSRNYTLKIQPYILDSILKENLNSFFNPRKIFLRSIRNSIFKDGISMEALTKDGPVTADIVLNVRDDSSIWAHKTLQNLLGLRKENKPLVVDGVECLDVAFQGKIGNRQRKISITRLDGLGTNLDITDEVKIDKDGYPTYDSIHHEANKLFTEIKHETDV